MLTTLPSTPPASKACATPCAAQRGRARTAARRRMRISSLRHASSRLPSAFSGGRHDVISRSACSVGATSRSWGVRPGAGGAPGGAPGSPGQLMGVHDSGCVRRTAELCRRHQALHTRLASPFRRRRASVSRRRPHGRAETPRRGREAHVAPARVEWCARSHSLPGTRMTLGRGGYTT